MLLHAMPVLFFLLKIFVSPKSHLINSEEYIFLPV